MTLKNVEGPPVYRNRRFKKAAYVVIPTVGAFGAGAVIAGAIPNSDGSVGACYISGQSGLKDSVRFVNSASDCVQGEQFVKLGAQGPAGAPGAPGPQGPPGQDGKGLLSKPTFPAAASDYLLEIDGIKGESADAKHKGEIEIESFSWGVTRKSSRGGGGGGGAGKVSFQDLHFESRVNKASPLLFKAAATGQHIKKAVLTVRKAGGDQQEYYKVTLSDVLVSSYQVGSQEPDGDGDIDSFSLNYAKIQVEYRPVQGDGSRGAAVKAGYDLKANKKV